MKRRDLIMSVTGLALIGATPAFAGGNSAAQLDSYCWAQAERVRPMLTSAEKEAYVANCKADASANQGRPK
jgi:hypothetical protein